MHTARQLAAELSVSARTIYRDINILSAAGVPILSQKGYRGGLSLLEGFSLDKACFTQTEQSNIVQALQILKSSNYPDAEPPLNKVASIKRHYIHPRLILSLAFDNRRNIIKMAVQGVTDRNARIPLQIIHTPHPQPLRFPSQDLHRPAATV